MEDFRNGLAKRLLCLMWLVLPLVIAPLVVQGQDSGQVQIDDVQFVSETTGKKDEEKRETFALLISGRGFGTDRGKITVTVTSTGGVVETAEVVSVTEDKLIIARLTADLDYDPLMVMVKVGQATGEGFVLEDEEENRDPVYVYWALMDPKNVSDIFGRRIAKRFVAWQVTVDNEHKQHKLLIHDLSLDLSEVQGEWISSVGENGEDNSEMSSRELSILRGVAEKGRLYDWRNFVFRILRGAGSIAGGLVGVAGFGPSYADGVAVFNGPLLTAYTETLPDLSDNQMIRLNDSAYLANTVVPQQQSRVVVVFMPQRLLMNKEERKMFWKEPTALFKVLDLRKVTVIVDYAFITETADIPPQLTAVVIDPEQAAKFEQDSPEVSGYILGNFLAGSEVSLADDVPEGLEVALAGTPTDTRLHFTLTSNKPVRRTDLKFQVAKESGFQVIAYPVGYTGRRPQITTMNVNAAELKEILEAGVGEVKGSLQGSDLGIIDTLTIKEAPEGSVTITVDGGNATELNFTIQANNQEFVPGTSFTIVLTTPKGHSATKTEVFPPAQGGTTDNQ